MRLAVALHGAVAELGSFPPNLLDLSDMFYNMWEWTGDWYTPDSYLLGEIMAKPSGPGSGDRGAARGGSCVCSATNCSAYRIDFRGKSPLGRAFNNMGFCCARSA